jgi:uncharacterized protein DUF6188
MYGISKNTDLSFLLGKIVEQVCLGQFQTQVHLEDASIRIESKHTLAFADGAREIVWERTGFPSDGISKLLGQTLTGVSVVEDGVLELAFSLGDRLLVFDDSDQYESFHIVCGKLHMVV